MLCPFILSVNNFILGFIILNYLFTQSKMSPLQGFDKLAMVCLLPNFRRPAASEQQQSQ